MADPVLAPGGGVIRPPRVDTKPAPGAGGTTGGGEFGGVSYSPSAVPGYLSGGGQTPSTTNPGDFYANQAERTPDVNSTLVDPIAVQIQKRLNSLFNRQVYGASPTEERLAGAQRKADQLASLGELRARYETERSPALISEINQKLQEMGISTTNTNRDVVHNAGETLFTDMQGNKVKTGVTYHTGTEDWQNTLNLADQQLAQLPGINRQVAQFGNDVIGEKIAGAGMREEDIKQGLGTVGDLVSQLLNQKLQEKFGNITEQAGQIRSGVGASLAARGLNQGSIGGQHIAQTYLAEQADKSAARTAAAETGGNVGRSIDDVVKQIDDRRRQIATKKTLAEAQTASDVAFDFDAGAINEKFKADIAKLDADNQSSGFLASLAGGLLGGAAKLFLGKIF